MRRFAATEAAPKHSEPDRGDEEADEPVETPCAASSAAAWQPEQRWWQGWQGWQSWQSWEQRQWEPEPASTSAKSAAEAKQEAKAKNRTAQRNKKANQGIDTTAMQLGSVHLSDIRSAETLWSFSRIM